MMVRLTIVTVAVVAIISATMVQQYILGMALGVVFGLVAMFMGFTVVQNSGSSGKFGTRPGDVTSRIGICLAAAGIAAAAIDPSRPFPPAFRAFYIVCMGIACVAALVLACRESSTPN